MMKLTQEGLIKEIEFLFEKFDLDLKEKNEVRMNIPLYNALQRFQYNFEYITQRQLKFDCYNCISKAIDLIQSWYILNSEPVEIKEIRPK